MIETLGQRVSRLRKARELTQEQLAKRVPGMSASAISQLEIGMSKGVKPDNLVALARGLGVSTDELVEGEGRIVVPVAGLRALHDVPIIGFAVANPTEEGHFDDMGFPPGAGEGYLPWPTKDPNAYALRVKGDSMQDRVRPGELIVLEPNASVSPGDDVVVRTKAGRSMVKVLLYRRGEEVTFGSINSAHKPITLALADVLSMHRVAAIVPRGANTKEDGGG